MCGFLALAAFLPLSAQEYYFRNYTRNDGLPQSTVNSILQDRLGFVWLATDGGGVARFDGHKMETFSIRDGMADNVILDLKETPDGNIWMAGEKRGLSVFDGTEFHQFDDRDGLANTELTALGYLEGTGIIAGTKNGRLFKRNGEKFEEWVLSGLPVGKAISSLETDSHGNLWIGTSGNGVYRVPPGQPAAKFLTAPDSTINSILEDQTGKIWVATESGVGLFEGGRFITPDFGSQIAGFRVMDLARDKEGTLWLGTYQHGLVHIDGDRVIEYSMDQGLSSMVVMDILLDDEQNLWIGTFRGGACLFHGEEIAIWRERDGLCSDIIRAVEESPNGVFWMGTYQSGACKFDSLGFHKFSVEEGMPSEMIMDIRTAPNGYVYFATLSGLAFYNGKRMQLVRTEPALPDNFIRCLYFDEDSTLWIGSNSAGVFQVRLNEKGNSGEVIQRFTRAEGLPENSIYHITRDSKNQMWFSTYSGIGILSGSRMEKFTRRDGLTDSRVNRVLEDRGGNIWVATSGGGLIFFEGGRLDNEKGKRVFDTNTGLDEDNIVSMEEDNRGNLWIATETTVEVLNLKHFLEAGDVEIVRFDKHNGFVGEENLKNAIHKDQTGNIWLGTLNGVLEFKPEVVDRHVHPPKIILRDVQLFREVTDWEDKFSAQIDEKTGLPIDLVLPHGQNHLTFEFTGINFTNPYKVQYRHKLTGFDSDWSKSTRIPYVTYSNLPPGQYTFEVVAASQGTDWDREPATFSFKISPPWWQRWWFYTLSFVVVFALVYGFVSYRIRSIRIFNEQLQIEIEQRKRTEAKLVETNRDLDTLLYRTAHDLKAPLATSLGMLDLAISDTEAPETLQYFEMVKISNTQLNNIVDNLLEITQIKQRSLSYSPTNVTLLAKEVWESLADEPGYDRVKFEDNSEPGFSPTVDAELLTFIIHNLFQNGINYRDEKKEECTLLFRAEKMGNATLFTVRDNGVGIKPEATEKIFQMFYRGSNRKESTGLGLYVVKEAISRMDGSITVDSQVGQGSTFRIRIPLPEKG